MPYSFLHIAALRNDVNGAIKYLEGGDKDEVHVWPGMDGKKAIIQPIDVDERDVQGWTPLMCAATHGHLDMAQLLVDYGADVNARKNFSVGPLHLASRSGHVEVMAFLLEAGADVSMEKVDLGVPLHDAAFGGHKAAADLLLKFGQDDTGISCKEHLSKRMDNGQTPLHIASKNGHSDLVKLFVSCGAAVTARDEHGRQPHEVAKNRRTLIAFPNVSDPIDVQSDDIGAMSKDFLDSAKPLKEQRRHSQVGHRRASISGHKGSVTRPRTGDVGNFTSSLGILKEHRY